MCFNGMNGKCMHIMYSYNEDGVDMYDEPNENTKYIGFYMDYKSKKSKDPKDYIWDKIENCKMGQCDFRY